MDWRSEKHGEHGAYVTFKIPLILASASRARSCVESAFHKASPPANRQDIECCEVGDSDCEERSSKYYFAHKGSSRAPSDGKNGTTAIDE